MSANYSYMDKTQRSNINQEVERLTKENRILKNEHEMEMNKLHNENRSLARRIS